MGGTGLRDAEGGHTGGRKGGLQKRGCFKAGCALQAEVSQKGQHWKRGGGGGGRSLSMKELGHPGVAHLSRLLPPSVLPFAGVRTCLKGRCWALRKAADPHPSIP